MVLVAAKGTRLFPLRGVGTTPPASVAGKPIILVKMCQVADA